MSTQSQLANTVLNYIGHAFTWFDRLGPRLIKLVISVYREASHGNGPQIVPRLHQSPHEDESTCTLSVGRKSFAGVPPEGLE